ncbi:MAG: hypothetical protein QW429_00480 [Thermoprotei archaeon]
MSMSQPTYTFLVAIILIAVLSLLLYTKNIPLEVFTAIIGVIVGYYFGYHSATIMYRRHG